MVNAGQAFLEAIEIQLPFTLRIQLLPQLLDPSIPRVLLIAEDKLYKLLRRVAQDVIIDSRLEAFVGSADIEIMAG